MHLGYFMLWSPPFIGIGILLSFVYLLPHRFNMIDDDSQFIPGQQPELQRNFSTL